MLSYAVTARYYDKIKDMAVEMRSALGLYHGVDEACVEQQIGCSGTHTPVPIDWQRLFCLDSSVALDMTSPVHSDCQSRHLIPLNK